MAPVSLEAPVASTLSVMVLVNALVGVGGEMNVTASGAVMVLPAKVTRPSERAPPSRDAPAPSVIAPIAIMVPANEDDAPVVTAPLTCQKTLDAWAPLIKWIVEDAAVLRAALIWKMKTALGSFWPSSVIVPVSEIAAAAE